VQRTESALIRSQYRALPIAEGRIIRRAVGITTDGERGGKRDHGG
jgi:hypothetical protein